jgi:hypothetical protein
MNGVFIQSSKDPRFRACILRLKALKEQRKTLTDSRQKHNCHPNFCKPENESDNNIPNPIACNIFICRYGSVHFCTAEDCGLYGGSLNGTCPISGIQHNALDISGYDKEKSHTWYRQHEERRADVQTVTARFLLSGKEEIEEKVVTVVETTTVIQKRRRAAYTKQLTPKEAEQAASKIVKLLLYSPARKKFIERCIDQNHRDGDEVKSQYIYNQIVEEHQLPYAADIYLYKAYHSCKPLPLKEFTFDAHLHDYYVFVIMEVWNMVQRFHVPYNQKRFDGDEEIIPSLNFDAISVGTLYLMRKGYKHNNILLLPADDFLLFNLPKVNTYNEFGLEKSLVTQGDKLITEAIENAFGDNAPIADIVMDLEKMPQRETHQIIETNRGLVKMSSSGEKLFMPSSRKKLKK